MDPSSLSYSQVNSPSCSTFSAFPLSRHYHYRTPATRSHAAYLHLFRRADPPLHDHHSSSATSTGSSSQTSCSSAGTPPPSPTSPPPALEPRATMRTPPPRPLLPYSSQLRATPLSSSTGATYFNKRYNYRVWRAHYPQPPAALFHSYSHLAPSVRRRPPPPPSAQLAPVERAKALLPPQRPAPPLHAPRPGASVRYTLHTAKSATARPPQTLLRGDMTSILNERPAEVVIDDGIVTDDCLPHPEPCPSPCCQENDDSLY